MKINNRTVKAVLSGLFVLLSGTTISFAFGQNDQMAGIIGRGDVVRESAPQAGQEWIPLYLGNGRLGSCYGPWGLYLKPDSTVNYRPRGVTAFMHMKHWVRAKYNADYLLPVAAVYWESEPQAVEQYKRALKIAPNDENIYYNLGRALLEAAMHEEATKAFRTALKINPNFTEVKELLATL